MLFANLIKNNHIIELVESEGIDDFGTGYSNFEYLLKLDADYIKIDGSLIKEIHNNPHMRLVTETIVSFARISGMKTIAEFVANEEIADTVREIGVDYLQGHYIGEASSYKRIGDFSQG